MSIRFGPCFWGNISVVKTLRPKYRIAVRNSSFILDICIVPLKSTTTLRRSRHTGMLQTTTSEVLFQGPYVAAIVGFEPATLRMLGTDPHNMLSIVGRVYGTPQRL